MIDLYKFNNLGPGVIRLSDNAVISPGDTAAWREYMEWMYSGHEALPADPLPPVMRLKLPKSVIVERMTDEELELFKSIKPSLPARLLFLWDEATNNMVNPDDERLINAFTQILGATRTSEVLQPE